MSVTLLRKVGYFFLQRRSKKWIIKCESKHNNNYDAAVQHNYYDVFLLRPTCLCFSHGNAIFQLISHKFLIGLCIVCLRAKAHNLDFIICSLVVGID